MVINGRHVSGTDWDAAVAGAAADERPFLAAQARVARLLGSVDGGPLTGPLLGWLVLCGRALQAGEDARALARSRAAFAVPLLQRAVGDSTLDLAFALGLAERGEDVDVGERLGAYAAWCLWSEANDADRVLHHRDLDRAYDPSDAVALLGDPASRELFPGLLAVETEPAALRAQKRAHEDELHGRAEQARALARRLDLDGWLATLDEGVRQGRPYFSLRELVTGERTSAFDEFRRHGLAFAHSAYRRQSAIAHGSTVLPFVHTTADAATPLPAVPPVLARDERATLADGLEALVQLLEVALALLRREGG